MEKFRRFSSNRRTLFGEFELKPGKYVAWAKIDFDPNFEEDFEVNLAIYSEYACRIGIASREEAIIYKDGNAGIEWTGERIPINNPEKKKEEGEISEESILSDVRPNEEKGNMILFDFLNRDRNANDEGVEKIGYK